MKEIKFEKLDRDFRNKSYDEFADWFNSLSYEPSCVNCWIEGYLRGMRFSGTMTPTPENKKAGIK